MDDGSVIYDLGTKNEADKYADEFGRRVARTTFF